MADVALTHIGGPTVLIEIAGWRIITDPTFDPPGGSYKFGWGTASTKTSGPACTTAELGAIDAVLLTHDHHADNLDLAGRRLMDSVPIVVTTVAAARRLGGQASGLANWQTMDIRAPGRETITITATPCRHGPPLSRAIVGDVIGFALNADALPHGAIWISGDTVLYRGVSSVADRIKVDIAIVHVGSVRFPITGPLRYSMTIEDAVELCRSIQPTMAFPVHYEGWSHFKQGRAAIDRAIEEGDQSVPMVVLPQGQRTLVDRLRNLNRPQPGIVQNRTDGKRTS